MKEMEMKRKNTAPESILETDYKGMLKDLAAAWEGIDDEQCASSSRYVDALEARCKQDGAQVALGAARLRLELARYGAHIMQYGDPLDRLRRTEEEWTFCRLLDAERQYIFTGEGPALTDEQLRWLLQELILRNALYAALADDAGMRHILFADNEAEAENGGRLPRLALQDAVLKRLGYLDYRVVALLHEAIEPHEEAES